MHYLIGAITLIHCQYKIHTPGGFEPGSATCPNPLFFLPRSLSLPSFLPPLPLFFSFPFFLLFTNACTCNKFLRSFYALNGIIFCVFSSVGAGCCWAVIAVQLSCSMYYPSLWWSFFFVKGQHKIKKKSKTYFELIRNATSALHYRQRCTCFLWARNCW